ncbi:MAG: tetratricopeptide repeat protein, partial [Bacteroidota bacterium]
HTDDKETNARSQMLLENTYNSLSVSYFSLNDYQNAIAYSEKCLQLLDAIAPENPQRAINLMYIGRSIYERDRNIDSAFFYMDASLKLIENGNPATGLGKGSAAWISYSSYKSAILLRSGKRDEAITFSKSVIDFVKKNNMLNAATVEVVLMHYQNVANAYIDQDNLQPALKTCEEAEVMMKQFPNVRNILLSILNSQHAKVLFKLYKWKEAEDFFNKALAPVNLSIAALKDAKWNVDVSAPREYLGTIKDAGDYFLFRGFARTNKENVKTGIDVLNKVAKTFISQQNFLFEAGINEGFGMLNQNLFEDLLQALYKSRNLLNEDAVMAHAFSTIESAKANLLKNVVWEEKKLSEILPDSVNRKRLDMKNEVKKAMNAVRQTNNSENQSSFIDKRESYMEYLRKIKKDFSFDDLKNADAVSANDLRLTEFKGTIMNYFLGEKNLYIFIHSNFRKYFVCKKIPENFEKDLALVRNSYHDKSSLSEIKNLEDLKRISKQWYQW